MARIAYADITRPEVRPLADDIAAARGSVLHLYRMLLHSPPVAAGWLALLSAVRHDCTLPGSLRELVIMRIAHLNGAPYEADQHAPIALAEGVTQTQLDALPRWQDQADLFDERQRAVLELADAMTRAVHVDDDAFAAAKALFDERMLVELVVTVAAYNMVSRVLEALHIRSDDVTTAQ
jgi:AhpD family alkylhydroperoxidase